MFRYSPSFLHELALRAVSTQLEHEAGVLRDLRWMRNRMQEDSPVTIRSCAHLHRVHDAHIDRMNRTEFRVVDPLPFPEPPLAPDDPLEPVHPASSIAHANSPIAPTAIRPRGRTTPLP